MIAFCGLYSTITEDAIHSVTNIMNRLAMSNFNFNSSFTSCVNLNDLKESEDQTFEELLSNPSAKTTIKDKKLLDFLLRGFSLSSRLTGGFDEKSGQAVFNAFAEKIAPGYVKSILNQILGFRDSNTTISELGQLLSPHEATDEDRVTNVYLDNFHTKIQEKLADEGTHFADIFDLSDSLGKEVSSLLNLGGIFVNEFFEGLLEQAADDFEIGILKWNCHVELGLKSEGLMDYMNALYSKME